MISPSSSKPWSILAIAIACACSREPATATPTSPAASPSPAATTVATIAHEVAAVSLPLGMEATIPQSAHGSETLLLVGARLIDGTGGPVREDVDVRVEAGRIAAVGRDLPPVAGARTIDLGGRTLLPGFIDSHVHLAFSPAGSFADGVVKHVRSTEADRALEGAANARATLEAGFTTVRVVGGGLSDRALRDAVVSGHVVGPRMLVANHAIGITGGHCDDTNAMHPAAFISHQDFRAGVADGPEEVRKAVRYQIKHGADVIKLCATGGVMSQGDAVGATQMTREELAAAVSEAVKAERRVAAHAHGNEGIRLAVEAGVHSIEHGSILDAPTIALMKKRGTYLVPTIYVASAVEELAAAGKLSADSAAKVAEITPKMKASFALAARSGVRIALGSDAGVFPHGENGREFAAMVRHGLSNADAIAAGTSSAAALLGVDNVGRVAPGMLADLVVVEDDPLTDIGVLEHPALVIKGGVVHVGPTWGD